MWYLCRNFLNFLNVNNFKQPLRREKKNCDSSFEDERLGTELNTRFFVELHLC